MAGLSFVALFIYLSVFSDSTTTTQAQSDDNLEDDSLRPWENPLQELQNITSGCFQKIPEIFDITSRELKKWQACVDKITLPVTEKYPNVLESRRNGKNEDDEQINSTTIYEIDKQLHMVICKNTSAYKSCWSGVINTLNSCDSGSGDIAGKIYFALYDDICRAGGQATVENRRKAALGGSLCQRDYDTTECITNQENKYSKDLCLRFQSNVACDLSSIDPNCTNTVDKGLHADIFQRVERVLECTKLSESSTVDYKSSASAGFSKSDSFAFFIIVFTLLVLVLYVA